MSPWIFVGGIVLLVVVIIVLAVRHERRAAAALLAGLHTRGFTVIRRPPKEERVALYAPFEALKLPRGGRALKMLAHREDADTRTTRFMKHQYTIYAGNTVIIVTNTAVQVDAPSNWPRVRLQRAHLGHKLIKMVGMTDLEVEDPVFNKAWRVSSDHDDFALLVLSEEVQELLRDPPKHEAWSIGAGGIICHRSAAAKLKDIDAMHDRLEQLRSRLAPELDAWDSAPPA